MANQINRVPRGWLGLLRSKVGGQTPRTWEDKLRPVMELRQLYANAQMVYSAFQTTDATTGGGTNLGGISVPSDEAWMVHTIGLTMDTANTTLADSGGYAVVLRNLEENQTAVGTGDPPQLLVVPYDKPTTTLRFATGGVLFAGGNLIVQPGNAISVTLIRATAAVTRTINMTVVYTKMDV